MDDTNFENKFIGKSEKKSGQTRRTNDKYDIEKQKDAKDGKDSLVRADKRPALWKSIKKIKIKLKRDTVIRNDIFC